MLNIRSNIAYFLPPDPIRNQGYLDTLRHTKPDNDPEAPPPKKPGDAVIVRSAIIGLLLGGIIGFFIGLRFGPGITTSSTFAGIFIGGIIGAFTGEFLKNRRFRHQS
jgi:hypothetical protein